MESRIYLDNAATSWPKPDQVYQAVDRYQRTSGAPAGRSGYREAADVGQVIHDLRWNLLQLLDAPPDTYDALLAYSGTDALNTLLLGLLRPGDRVVTTAAEHNSVLRPLRYLADERGVEVDVVPLAADGRLSLEAWEQALREPTRLAAVTHASNVTGVVQPIEAACRLAQAAGARVLIDAAQTVGQLPLSLRQVPADAVAAPGHKGLLGPLGTGVLWLSKDCQPHVLPLRWGGTGTSSESDRQPVEYPDRMEAGNANVPGLLGLAAGVEWLLAAGVREQGAHHRTLIEGLIAELGRLHGVRLYGADLNVERIGVVSLMVDGYEPQEVAASLETAARIQVRAGLHCAPRMHAALGTLTSGGTVRASVGPFTTRDEIDKLVEVVGALAAAGLDVA
ncbi:MAG: aminotransferase class V-fold PLP-dependent enzyme [Pirellulales bacterium]